MLELPIAEAGISAVPLDIRAAAEADPVVYEQAQRVAEHEAELARGRGSKPSRLSLRPS